MNPYATHQPILLGTLKLTNKQILEIGIGDFSTQLIHDSFSGKITSIDDNLEWLVKYGHLKCERHNFIRFYKDNYKTFFNNDKKEYGLVFIDASTWAQRNYAIITYKDTADYLIIHDSEGRGLNAFFKYSIEFTPVDGPATLIGSNIIVLKDMDLKDYSKKYYGENDTKTESKNKD